MKPSLSDWLCIALLAGGMVLALRANPRGELNHILPVALRNWINEDHDEAENLIAFSILGVFALSLSRRAPSTAASPVIHLLQSRAARMVALMSLVCGIELVQFFILGRMPDMKDVCTGWSGIFAAWLLGVLRDARAEHCARLTVDAK